MPVVVAKKEEYTSMNYVDVKKELNYNNMKITLLTAEESVKAWEEMKAENATLTREQVQDWAMRLPKNMSGNTDYIIGQDNWEKFYEWVLTDEGYEQWKIDLDIVEYIRNWAFKNQKFN